MTTITGNTYPVRDALKALGARWNRPAQGWDVPDQHAETARAIVAAAGPATTRPRYGRTRAGGSRYTRFNSGAEVFTNTHGRCEDAPCCGCCS